MDIKPLIWRRIEVLSDYNFWDLHVAIQDVMGWMEEHPHMFKVKKFGVPFLFGEFDEEIDDPDVKAGCKYVIADYFQKKGDKATYIYDFGDNWKHKIILESINDLDKGVKYPRCLNGARACPPEDCGGVIGYYDLIEALEAPSESKEYEEDVYKPENFNPSKVKFSNYLRNT